MTNYFENCHTVAEIKAAYRVLAREYHPDLNRDRDTTEIMKTINAQYEKALASCNGQTSKDDQGNDHAYRYDQEVERRIMAKLSEFWALNLEGIDAWIIGSWIWFTGNTKPHKAALGKDGLKLNWHSKKLCWYYKATEGRYFSSGKDLTELAATYGATNADHFRNKSRSPKAKAIA